MIFGKRGGKFLVRAGKFVNCECCGHESPCNSAGISDTLDFVVNYGANTLPVTLTWSAIACGGISEGWEWNGPDATICTGFLLRAVTLCCSGTTWNLSILFVISGIATAFGNPADYPNLTIVAPSPMHLTTETYGDVSTPCGLDPILIDIEAT